MAETKFVTAASGALKPFTPVFVDTIADLRALTEQWPIVHVHGHTTAEDGGGGEFRLIGTGATAGDIGSGGHDDDGFHIVNANGIIWQRQSDVVTPKMFGALPAMTSVAARSATNVAARFQRAFDFYAYPADFPGTAQAAVQLETRSFEVGSGFYRCESTINMHFNNFNGEPLAGYSWMDYYSPGPCIMRGHVWTPYNTDIVAISYRQHTNGGQPDIRLSCVKDVISVGGSDTTYAKKWLTTTWPQIYTDDTCMRSWATTKFYKDEDIKYVSASITYVFRCTKTGTPSSGTPSDLTGTLFTDGGAFYCRGISRLANGKNMDDMFMDTTDVGIHVKDMTNVSDVTLRAANYAIGVRVGGHEVSGVAWNSFEIPRVAGCKCGVVVNSWNCHRKVELNGRLALQNFPTGHIAWETAYPLAYYLTRPWKEWTSGGTAIALNDVLRYKLDYPVGWDQPGYTDGQYWCWRVTTAGTGVLGTTPPAAAQTDGLPWTSGGVTMVCIGSYHGTRYVYNGGGESTPGNWSEAAAGLQQQNLLGWVNDNTFRVRYIIPRWQGTPSIPDDTSTYGVVLTGPYDNNNNHFDMADMTPTQITSTSKRCEGVEYLVYSGMQNTFHCRQEDVTSTASMVCPLRKPPYVPALNVCRTARNPDLGGTALYRRQRGSGAGNMVLGPMELPYTDARFEVDFSKMLYFSSYDRIYARGLAWLTMDTPSTLSYAPYVLAGLTNHVVDTPRYHPEDDSWQTALDQFPGVVVDLSNDITGCYMIRVVVELGDPNATITPYYRWNLVPLEVDGLTKISPDVIGDSTVGSGNYASVPLVAEIGNGVSPIRTQQTATSYWITDDSPVYNSRHLVLGVNPLIKMFAFGIRGRHIRGWTIEVLGSTGAKIYSPTQNGIRYGYSDSFSPVINAMPAKGRIAAPTMYRYADGTASAAFTKFKMATGQVYWCTSGVTGGLTPSTNRMWGHTGAVQGSATIEEWNGSTWTTIATNAYFTEPSATYFGDIP